MWKVQVNHMWHRGKECVELYLHFYSFILANDLLN